MVKGSYCLLIRCIRDQNIKIGRLGTLKFKRGFYMYVGSALNGLEKRILRHLGKRKRKFWHIDYLLSNRYVRIDYIYFFRSNRKIECDIADKIKTAGRAIKGFGASDCRCKSHLFSVGA